MTDNTNSPRRMVSYTDCRGRRRRVDLLRRSNGRPGVNVVSVLLNVNRRRFLGSEPDPDQLTGNRVFEGLSDKKTNNQWVNDKRGMKTD